MLNLQFSIVVPGLQKILDFIKAVPYQVNVREYEMLTNVLPELQKCLDENCEGEQMERFITTSFLATWKSNFQCFSAKLLQNSKVVTAGFFCMGVPEIIYCYYSADEIHDAFIIENLVDSGEHLFK